MAGASESAGAVSTGRSAAGSPAESAAGASASGAAVPPEETCSSPPTGTGASALPMTGSAAGGGAVIGSSTGAAAVDRRIARSCAGAAGAAGLWAAAAGPEWNVTAAAGAAPDGAAAFVPPCAWRADDRGDLAGGQGRGPAERCGATAAAGGGCATSGPADADQLRQQRHRPGARGRERRERPAHAAQRVAVFPAP
jgi:hypothetical protein